MSVQIDGEDVRGLLDDLTARELLELASELGSHTDGPSPDTPQAALRKQGDMWQIRYNGQTTYVKSRVGLRYLVPLLRAPGRAFPVSVLHHHRGRPPRSGRQTTDDLAAFDNHGASPSVPQPLTDRAALAACRERLRQIESELEGAHEGDGERIDELERERDQIHDYLRSCNGANGRIRPVPDQLERIRKAVSNAITRAIEGIHDQHPELGRHLRCSIKTGYNVSYEPPDDLHWEF